MLERYDSKTFSYILGISAVLVALMAAIFSVTGLYLVYSGSKVVAFAMGVLEFTKLVTASFLYRYWNDITRKLKIYLTTSVIILMLITSGGIYGYLTNAYQGATIGINKVNTQIDILNQKKENLIAERERLTGDISSLRIERQSTIENRNNEIKSNNMSVDSITVK